MYYFSIEQLTSLFLDKLTKLSNPVANDSNDSVFNVHEIYKQFLHFDKYYVFENSSTEISSLKKISSTNFGTRRS